MILRFLFYLLPFIVVVDAAESLANVAWKDKCAALSWPYFGGFESLTGRYPCLNNGEAWERGPPCIEYSQGFFVLRILIKIQFATAMTIAPMAATRWNRSAARKAKPRCPNLKQAFQRPSQMVSALGKIKQSYYIFKNDQKRI